MADAPPTSAGPSAGAAPRRRRRGAWRVLAFAAAAVASSWNPVAAPFGLVVGVVAVVLAIRALRRDRPRRKADLAALGLGTLAVLVSAVVIAVTAGAVGVDLPGKPVVQGRTAAELDQVLSESAERTRARRQRAIEELDATGEGTAGDRPTIGPAPRAKRGSAPDGHAR